MVLDSVIVGDSATAHVWVEGSSLHEVDKFFLLRFIDRFPALTFYHDKGMRLDNIEEGQHVTLPRWFGTLYQTLTFVMPDHYVDVRFDHCLYPYVDDRDLQQHWYLLNTFRVPPPHERALLDRMQRLQLLRVGEDDTAGLLTLAINLADHTDQQVYAYNLEDLETADQESSLEEWVDPMFASYADMFGHIIAVRMTAKDMADTLAEEDWMRTVVEAQ